VRLQLTALALALLLLREAIPQQQQDTQEWHT
jgi:hypothetical protein